MVLAGAVPAMIMQAVILNSYEARGGGGQGPGGTEKYYKNM